MASTNFTVYPVENVLTSTSTTKSLSASQGKTLNDTKADKVSEAVEGNFASLNLQGNIADSGKKATDFVAKPSNVTAGKFLQTDSHGDAIWGDPAASADVSSAVETWLEENVPAGQTLVVDKTLTVSGAAADSKATGDEIYSINSALTSIESTTANNRSRVTQLEATTRNHVSGGEVIDGVAYFYNDENEEIFSITGIGGGGGGGGGGSSSTTVMTCTNTTGWTAASFAPDNDVILSLNWTSLEDDISTGSGSLSVSVNGAVKSVTNVPQGNISVNVKNYLIVGTNQIKLTITDADGNNRTKTFNVTIVNVSMTSTFDDSVVQTGPITFVYTPWGDVSKVVHISVDGTELETVTTSFSGRQMTYSIPAQTHGSHIIEAWFTATLNDQPITSNVLHYEIVCIVAGNNTPIISSSFSQETVSQYTTVSIPYMVYTPNSQVSSVTILVNDTVVQTLPSIDRSMQSFSYRFDDYDETGSSHEVTIQSGSTTKTLEIVVTQSDVHIEPVQENLSLYLSARSRSNSESNPGVWTYGTGADQISCTFNDFNFVSNGWVQDEDGVMALRINGDAELTIPYQLFAEDFRATGKTIEFEFATRDVRNYSNVLVDCMSNGRGFQITAQDCRIASEQSSLQTQFKEDEHVRVSFVVDKGSELRLIRCYINGIMSAVVQYPTNDDFTQVTPENITISGNGNTIDLYCIRIYDSDLTSQQVEENWIADTPNGGLMLERYSHNNVRDEYGKIVTNKLPNDLPYMIVSSPRLPQYKGDKVICSGSYVNPLNPTKSFTFENAQFDVQGTSSQYYSRKNYKAKFNNGFIANNGAISAKYALRDDSIPVKTFCFKADVASSEGANNVELVRLYEDACPYRTPAQEANPKVRQGIDGFPMVIFWNNPDTGETQFLGKYNFNNDKSTEDVFGFEEGDESWEIRNNTSNRVIWRSDDYTGRAWLNDFEARYPDTDPAYEDPTQLKEFASWVRSTDPTQATGDALTSSVTYPSVVVTYEEHEDIDTGEITYEEVRTTVNVTYTNDTAEYRKAKFRAELGNYVEIDSALFYYLFTELFLMIDSRAKNAFPSFIGSVIN